MSISAMNGDTLSPTQVVASFQEAVIKRCQIQLDSRVYGYQEYLAQPEEKRHGDEANAVDQQFTRYVLEWLGFTPSDWTYNQNQPAQRATRPDYVVRGLIGIAFIWEDKNTTVDLEIEHLEKMRRYCSETAGYAVWCNMRRLFALRFIFENDLLKYEILADIALERLFGKESLSPETWETQATGLAHFSLLFGKTRFTQFAQLVDKITVSEDVFESEAKRFETEDSIHHFIAESRESLNHLRLSALAQILDAYESWLTQATRINSTLLALHFEDADSVRIAEAYQIWSETQSDQEDIRPEVFAEQVAYVFFIRILLVRVLEDKHIFHPRLLSNGGFTDGVAYVKRHFQELDGIGVLNENYTNILSRKASTFYMHFFQQAIFEWFNPDDFLLVETLEFLCRYNFESVTNDIIGFTYEEYIDRTARNRKGHFLTRQDVVEYMLDLLEYSGPQVIGRRIFDPACGSGSFLVHAARRYRRALVSYFCNKYNLADSEEVLNNNPQYRKELAHRYLDDLSSLFYGMELNPFACYLAEMNLLIQGLDDLAVLQETTRVHGIARFHIYNTDSLRMPREVLASADVRSDIQVPDRLSERITDESYPIKAKREEYAEGFFYIISNPPYVNSRQEELFTPRFRNAEFFKAALSGDTNLYLLFLRLGLYYLADFGQMIYIMPLTIFGDKSAAPMRRLLKTPPFSPSVAIRFYRGDILFPGVDQAVAIVRVNRSVPDTSIIVGGGDDIAEARTTQMSTSSTNVIDVVPPNESWQGCWLVTHNQSSLDVWQHVKQVSNDLLFRLGIILDEMFYRKQGDVNATHLNPLRLGSGNGSFTNGDIAVYKGEDIQMYAPLPLGPSDWARIKQPLEDEDETRETKRTLQVLEQLKQINGKERGIILREVARLNTRERLIASWFERTSDMPVVFTNELWRMALKEEFSVEYGKALLALFGSKTAAYLVNLFSTNNHVSKEGLDRLPIPNPETMPVAQLAQLADRLLSERASLEQDFVLAYRVRLPDSDEESVYVPPSRVLAATRLPKLNIQSLVGRGEIRNTGPLNGRIRALRARNAIVSTLPTTSANGQPFARVLELFLNEPERENETWSQAQNWQLPDPVASASWLATYDGIVEQAQAKWDAFVQLQQQADQAVADWYGFTPVMCAAIDEGLPWARRKRS